MIKAEKIKECPYCGHNTFYHNVYISGFSTQYYNFGEAKDTQHTMAEDMPDNSTIFDHIKIKEFKTAYCEQCHKKIC